MANSKQTEMFDELLAQAIPNDVLKSSIIKYDERISIAPSYEWSCIKDES